MKVLEERGELSTYHAKVSIGILIMQDIFAVVFISASTGKTPNIFALFLLLLPIIYRMRVLDFVLDRCHHGEILPLFGLSVSLVAGYILFELMGLKGDLGALTVGVLLRGNERSSELAKSLLIMKDILLVGFFINIGLNAALTVDALLASCVLLLLLPLKVIIYYVLTNIFYLRARTSLICALTLSNFSEFALIVTDIAVSEEWLDPEWLTVVSIAIAISFIISSPLNSRANHFYTRLEDFLLRYEKNHRVEEEREVEIPGSKVVIFGMGRIGFGVYEKLTEEKAIFEKGDIVGVDINSHLVKKLEQEGLCVILADATDPDFWANLVLDSVELIVFSMPKHDQNLNAIRQLQSAKFYRQWIEGGNRVASVVKYDDDEQELKKLGVWTYNIYKGTGGAFGEHLLTGLDDIEAAHQVKMVTHSV